MCRSSRDLESIAAVPAGGGLESSENVPLLLRRYSVQSGKKRRGSAASAARVACRIPWFSSSKPGDEVEGSEVDEK